MPPFKIPHPDDSLHFFGKNVERILKGESLVLLVWNVFKGRKKAVFFKDFLQLTERADFILLQEAMIDQTMPELWQVHRDQHYWKMAASFEYLHDRSRTGVITGSLVRTESYQLIRSTEKEMSFWTPKVSLCSYYQIENLKEKLLIINTHVVNFATTNSFRIFVADLIHVIRAHQGPIILGGDFNTWNPWRWRALLESLQGFDLEHQAFAGDPRRLKLDHVFLRGFEIESAEIKHQIVSSDHFPIEIRLRLRG